MPYSTPSNPHYRQYVIHFRDSVNPDIDLEQMTHFEVRANLLSAPTEATEAAFQRLVDLIAGDSSFHLISATRAGEVTQEITPSEGDG